MKTMMGTGLGKNEDSAKAAEEAIENARQQLGDSRIDLVILFCSSNYDYNTVLQTVRKMTANAPLVGSSSAGEFTERDVGTGSIAATLIGSDDIKFYTGLAENVDKDAETAVANIITKIPSSVEGFPHRCVFLMADGMVGNGEEITLLVSNMAGENATVVGGLAGDDFKMEKTVVFHNDTFSEKAVSICVMASKKPFFTSVNHGHMPFTEPMQITKAVGNVLYEVEGKPAFQVWKEKTADAARDLNIDVHAIKESGEIAEYFANFELGLDTGDNVYKARYPMSINKDDSMNFTCAIPNNAPICIMDCRDQERQVEASRRSALMVKKAAEDSGYSKFAGAIVMECAVRLFLLGDDFNKAPEAITSVLGNIPMIGAETYGEIRMTPGEFSGFHNTTTVMLLLVE